MAASALCLLLRLDARLSRFGPGLLRWIHRLGDAAMGIYFIHILFQMQLNSQTIAGLPLYNNTGSAAAMLYSSAVYFALSAAVCVCAKSVRWVNKLF